MRKSLLISEQDNIAALLENDRVCEFFVNRGELLLGDIYTCSVENILPGIDAAFVNLGKDKMGFLHANDVPGQGPLKERLVPKQKLLVQITKEPTGHKGPRVSTAISLPGRFLVLVPEERGISISRRISESRERARLKAVVNLMKPPGVGLIIRTEAKGQGEDELFEDFQQLWDTWQTIVSEAEASIGPLLIYRDQDLLYRVIRDAYSHEVSEIIVDSPDGQRRAQDYLKGWASKSTKVLFHTGEDSLLVSKGMDKEIESALSERAELPSGGHLNIEPTEALTVIDVNSGRFTSSRTQAETVRRTNLEAAQEIPRQLRLRNIGGMVIVDFIDMESRKDQQQVLEVFQRSLEDDRAKPQVGQLSDLGLVELTRRRQGQSLRELFTQECNHCTGQGVMPTLELSNFDGPRAIDLKNEDEPVRGASSWGKSGAGLRSASVSQGRVVSTPITEEAVEEEVPEEILAQVPEDLLDDREWRITKARNAGLDDEEENGDEDAIEHRGEIVAAKTRLYDDSTENDEVDTLGRELKYNISGAAEVYHDISTTSGESDEDEDDEDNDDDDDEDEDDDDEQLVQSPAISDEDEDDDDDDEEVEVETEPEIPAVEYEIERSPFEAIEGPVSGVFRLKSVASDESSSDQSNEDESRALVTPEGESTQEHQHSHDAHQENNAGNWSEEHHETNLPADDTDEYNSTNRYDTTGNAKDDDNEFANEERHRSGSSYGAGGEGTGYQQTAGQHEVYDQLKIMTVDRESETHSESQHSDTEHNQSEE